MNSYPDSEIYEQTVPVFIDFAARIVNVATYTVEQPSLLDTRLVPDTFSAGEHLVVAQGFILRTIFPVLNRDCPVLTVEQPTLVSISQRHNEIMVVLDSLSKSDFNATAVRQISHVAGEATIVQNGADYVRLFAVPNFFFHFTMGYASLRAAGIEIGKAQFDGLHSYSPGFSFVP